MNGVEVVLATTECVLYGKDASIFQNRVSTAKHWTCYGKKKKPSKGTV